MFRTANRIVANRIVANRALGCVVIALACFSAACSGSATQSGAGGSGGASTTSSTTTDGSTGTFTETETVSGSSSGGPPLGGGPCVNNQDCYLVSDCCSCLGVANGQAAPGCDLPECFGPRCEAEGFNGVEAASCSAGQCVAGFDCDIAKVGCDEPQPECDPGLSPTVIDGCWGPCLPVSQCASVSSCEQCDQSSQLCVKDSGEEYTAYHCVNLPDECKDDRSCACMGKSVCVGDFDECVDDPVENRLTCSCSLC